MRTSHQVYSKFSQTSKMELFGKELLAFPKISISDVDWVLNKRLRSRFWNFSKLPTKTLQRWPLTSLRFLYYLYWKNFTSSYSLCLCCYLYKFLSKEEGKYIYRMKNYRCNLRKQNLSKCSLAPKAYSKIIFI